LTTVFYEENRDIKSGSMFNVVNKTPPLNI